MVVDHLVVLGVRDFQVNLVSQEILAQMVLLASAAHLAGRETTDPPVNLDNVATLVPLVQTVHRVLLVYQDPCLQPTASSSPDTARIRMCPAVLKELTSSMTATPCCTCRAMRGHMDRISARLAAVCAGSAPCPSCSAT